jgi:hypothetical protein
MVIHGRFHAQTVLLAADRGGRQHERENRNYYCLGFHTSS